MRAELQGKLDVSRSTDQSRLEDTLTDAVLSCFRYLPKDTVLGQFLKQAFPAVSFASPAVERAKIELWPRMASGTEPDAGIIVDGWLVLLEAKYRSDFGVGADRIHQLEREWRDGLEHAAARRLKGPLLVAVTDHPSVPGEVDAACLELADAVADATGRQADEVIRWMSWQQVANLIEAERPDRSEGGRELIDDVLQVMQARGVRRMFEGFSKADYWLLAAARDAAEHRVYPAISELRHELLGLLEPDVGWGAGDSGVWMYSSRAAEKPKDWPASSVTLPFWPEKWQKRVGTQTALVCSFSFVEPVISVGYVQIAKSIGDSSKHWSQRVEELTTALGGLPERYEVAVDDSYAKHSNFRSPDAVDASWLADSFKRARSLWIVQRFSVEEFDSAEMARSALLEAKAEIEKRPAILESAAAAGLVVGADLSG